MLVLDMLFVVSAVLFDMLKARQLACVSKSGQKCPAALSLSSWRAWIEISNHRQTERKSTSRSPHGERGLKYTIRVLSSRIRRSLSSWRAWIEISNRIICYFSYGRSPHGERGLKSRRHGRHFPQLLRRSPHGERGLKSCAPLTIRWKTIVALLMESVD